MRNKGELKDWLEVIRGGVRPVLMLSGWIALLVLVIMLVWHFATSDMAVVVVGIFSGAMTTMLGYWFSERKAKK